MSRDFPNRQHKLKSKQTTQTDNQTDIPKKPNQTTQTDIQKTFLNGTLKPIQTNQTDILENLNRQTKQTSRKTLTDKPNRHSINIP